MKSKSLLLAAAAVLLYLWHRQKQANGIDAIPVNLPPAQQATINALAPTVNGDGDILTPDVTSQITGFELLNG